ncbi:MAG: acyl-CoA carboxylase subunit beta [Candidatus Tectomicrobia bacterium]|uniref:Acyl-CoA carboxylase subunit beta n=1 Tax=Tectimicrobiota bacterium TaxID=2528274 RepID=A0A933LQ72_UNCTE|nr:acyl-CoA carboxylase subunit beta [Candidatus Tectomicrobia bacterium]
MEMRKQTEELNKWRATTLDAARAHAVEKQKALGKLTARQRQELLFDPGTFFEFGQLAQAVNLPDKESPADGVIVGIGKVQGRRVAVVNYDFTVMGGSQGRVNHTKTDHIHKIAVEQSIPIVYILDGGGARAQDLDTHGYHVAEMWYDQVRLSGWVPMVGAVMGPSYAGHANIAGLCDFVIMTEKTSSMGVGGTHLVRDSLGIEISHFELGGARMHTEVSGAADMLAADDADCLEKIRLFLSYFPTNGAELPPVIPCNDPINRREERLLDLVPFSQKQGYDMYRVIRAIVDHGVIFDIKAAWARNIITCLARLNGRVVGIVANQPMFMAGVIDTPASEKMSHFVEMCDAFNIPILLFTDVPGFMVGPEIERTGLARRSMKTLYALGHCAVPLICLVIRKAFGMGGYAMGAMRGFRPNMLLGWPSAEIGGMGLGGAVEILHRERIAKSENPQELKSQLVEELRKKMQAFATAKNYGFDDVIDPRDTRPVLIQALENLRRKEPYLPPKRHGIAPI